MSLDIPELGSKISLISKTDIRYEGRLFSVDSDYCSITLVNVKSFGTEDREMKYPIVPSGHLLDYMSFYAEDIKDIGMVNEVRDLNDPVIMQTEGQPPRCTRCGNSFGTIVSIMDMPSGASRCITPAKLISREDPSAHMNAQFNENQANFSEGGPSKRGNQASAEKVGVGNPQEDRRDSAKGMEQYNKMEDNGNENRNQMQTNNNQSRRSRSPTIDNKRGNPHGGGRMWSQIRRSFSKDRYMQEYAKNSAVFDQAGDSEEANEDTKELQSQLDTLKLDSESKRKAVNCEPDKKDDSRDETGVGGDELKKNARSGRCGKAKSFSGFSQEVAGDRTKDKNRTSWRRCIPLAKRDNSHPRGGYYNHMNMHGDGRIHRGYRGGNKYQGRNKRDEQEGVRAPKMETRNQLKKQPNQEKLQEPIRQLPEGEQQSTKAAKEKK